MTVSHMKDFCSSSGSHPDGCLCCASSLILWCASCPWWGIRLRHSRDAGTKLTLRWCLVWRLSKSLCLDVYWLRETGNEVVTREIIFPQVWGQRVRPLKTPLLPSHMDKHACMSSERTMRPLQISITTSGCSQCIGLVCIAPSLRWRPM